MDILGKSVTNVLSGIISSEEFPNSLKYLNLPVEKITEIIKDTNEKIFKRIRESLVGNTKIEETKGLESREELLRSIENPKPITKKAAPVILDAKNELVSGEKVEITTPLVTPVKTESNVGSILSQKLSQSFKIQTVETDHSLQNIQSAPDKDKKIGKSVDPYRELPE